MKKLKAKDGNIILNRKTNYLDLLDNHLAFSFRFLKIMLVFSQFLYDFFISMASLHTLQLILLDILFESITFGWQGKA